MRALKRHLAVAAAAVLCFMFLWTPAAAQLCSGHCAQDIGPGWFEIFCDPDGDVQAFECMNEDCVYTSLSYPPHSALVSTRLKRPNAHRSTLPHLRIVRWI